MASQRPFRSLQRGRKGGHLGSKIDFSEIDPEGGLRAWGAQKTHFYGDLSLFWPILAPLQAAEGLTRPGQIEGGAPSSHRKPNGSF